MIKTIVLAWMAALPCALAAAETACVHDMGGIVELRAPGASAWTPALKGRPLGEGHSVRTAEKAWCELLFRDGSFVRLEGGSEASAEQLKASAGERLFSFSFLKGRALWMAAKLKGGLKSRFSVRTPSAVCAVRGTDFFVEVSTSGATGTALFEGALDVSAGEQARTLAPGEEAAAAAGGLTVQGRLSRLMEAERRRYGKVKARVERLRARLAEREDYIDDFVARRRKAVEDFDARRRRKLGD